jgi:hypothetical protein
MKTSILYFIQHSAFRFPQTVYRFAVFFLGMAACLHAEDSGKAGTLPPPAGSVFVIPEPNFLLPISEASAQEPIPGSQRAKKVAARWDGESLRVLSPSEKSAWLATVDADVFAHAAQLANAELSLAHEIIVRSDKGVIEAVILSGERETFCSALFAPDLHKKYEEIFGEAFYAAVPTRYRIYLFPKLGGRPDAFAGAVLSDYRVSPAPVSPEIFEVRPGGMVRVVGILDDR